ncbi:hypothetical protein [Gorillibacterium sp. CAU 1737]|uniref:hypothetical protein n=1 Tax=Gorillibacterium sp. CAU 1737 TaxID=3140362 RepID=UPI003261CD91
MSTRKTILRFIPKKGWRKIVLFMVISLIFGELVPVTDNNLFMIPFIISMVIMLWIINKEFNSIRAKKYGTNEKYQKKRYDLLINILEQNSIYDPNRRDWTEGKIETLIQICNIKLRKPKFSSKTVSISGTILAIAIRTYPPAKLKIFLTQFPEPIAINVIILLIQLIGLAIMIVPILFELADRKHNKIVELRNMLLEIRLKYL